MSETVRLGTDLREMEGPAEAIGFGQALGGPGVTIAIGRDCDPGSRMMSNALASGLLSVGTRVLDAGTVPAPMLAAAGGLDLFIMVGNPDSTGHPPRWRTYNGDGSPVGAESLQEAYARLADGSAELQPYDRIGRVRPMNDVSGAYLEAISGSCCGSGAPVLLDCGCGSASSCAPRALAGTGCDLVCLDSHTEPLRRPRSPGVSEQEVLHIIDIIAHDPGSIGLAINGDGTRLALIDEAGSHASTEEVAALLAMHLRPERLIIPAGMSSLVGDAFLTGAGAPADDEARVPGEVVRTDGGHEGTARALAEGGGLGVTSDGGFIFPEVSLCPDAIHAATVLAGIAGGCSIRETLASLPGYTMLHDTVHMTANVETFGRRLAEVLGGIGASRIIKTGGWRADLDHGWFRITLSEDRAHADITAESADDVYAFGLMETARDLVRECM